MFKNISFGVAQKHLGIQEPALQAISVVQEALLPPRFDCEKLEVAAHFQSADRASGDW
jgi:hypothetical protein